LGYWKEIYYWISKTVQKKLQFGLRISILLSFPSFS